MRPSTNSIETTSFFTRQDLGTVWHTTEKGRDIVSMHDAQYRAHIARIAELEEAVGVLAESVYLVECDVDCDALHRGINNNPIAKAALDAARSGT